MGCDVDLRRYGYKDEAHTKISIHQTPTSIFLVGMIIIYKSSIIFCPN